MAIKNNFYVQVTSPNDQSEKCNTNYSFNLSFDTFEDTVQSKDILVINGEAIYDWIGYRNEEHSYLLQIKKNDQYAIRLTGDANDAILTICKVDGTVIEEKQITSNGTAFIDNIYLESGNYFVTVNSIDKGEGQFNTDYILSAFELKTLYPKIDNNDDTLNLAQLKESCAFNTTIENWLGTGDNVDFLKFTLPLENQQQTSLLLSIDTQTAQAIKDGILKINCYDNFGQELEIVPVSHGVWNIVTNLTTEDIYIAIQQDLTLEDMDYSIKVSKVIPPENLSGNSDGISWDAILGVSKYIVEYSLDNFNNILYLETNSNKVDFFNLPDGVWQWRVRAIGEGISNTQQIIATGNFAVQELVSKANDNTDIFFAKASGKWESQYVAQHSGILNAWSGTKEQIKLLGKNKLSDIFEGSSDANILILTDDKNGDALFVDDIYTTLPGTVSEQQSRIAQIHEIRAGVGDDIVDLTSSRFAYIGDGVKIYGGLGNDTIWANKGNNTLFGDAGNDRLVGGVNNDVIIGGIGNDSLHGGGGEDIFCFNDNFGCDTIEQLAGGKVTLYFESGQISNWNAKTQTYTDGKNSVKIYGTTDVTIKFGVNFPLVEGAFLDAASEKIFEDKDKGLLA